MNKTELAGQIAAKHGVTKKAAGEMIEMVVGAVSDALARDERLTLMGFGSFEPVVRAARTGRDPKTKRTIFIPSRKSAVLKPGRGLLERLNGGRLEPAAKQAP